MAENLPEPRGGGYHAPAMTRLPDIVRFDGFTLDRANRRLSRDGREVELGNRYFDALVLLVENSGNLVTKDEFMDRVWRGIPVTDEALTQCVRFLRKALGDDASAPRFIQTVPKHGYRFVGEIEDSDAQPVGPEGHGKDNLPSRIAGASTIAGALAGLGGGLFYAIAAGSGGISGLLAFGAMVGALGTLAGAGIGAALAAMLAWRGRADATLLLAGALGGAFTGAIGNLLGREGLAMLTGRTVGPVTGLAEGVLLGLAAGCTAWLVFAQRQPGTSAMLSASLVGGAAGALLHALGGRLLGGSLWSVEQALGSSRLALGNVGAWFGEAGFGEGAHGITALIEGAVFVLGLAIGYLAVRRLQRP